MTIHSEHPFLPPESERDPVRRWRGRLGGTVSLWTSGTGTGPDGQAGLTVSSYLVAAGEPGHVLALLDPDALLTDRMLQTRTAVVQLLEWKHRDLADAFAGVAPAPGGVFTLGRWVDTEWGPRLADASSWAGVRLSTGEAKTVGWSVLVDTVIEHLEIGEEHQRLVHHRGRYLRPT
ncbi:MAG TPA: flavin reductase [Nocardioidaceae bacterium]